MENNAVVNNAAANTANGMPGIKNSWTLLAFAKIHGRMQVGDNFINKDSGDKFTSCVFTDPNNPDNQTNKVFVAFSRNLGVLTPQEIAARKEELQVVELQNGRYALCATGNGSWKDVDLGI